MKRRSFFKAAAAVVGSAALPCSAPDPHTLCAAAFLDAAHAEMDRAYAAFARQMGAYLYGSNPFRTTSLVARCVPVSLLPEVNS